ncbi:MAG: GIDE domain-containing protein [Terriglobales bacterium]
MSIGSAERIHGSNVTVCLSFFIAIFTQITHPTILASVATASGLCSFFAGFHLLGRKRLVFSTPTSDIRGAALGPVEVNGVARGPYTTTAPIIGEPCFLYRTTVWQQREGKKQKWEQVADETLHLPFFIEDSTGQVLIDPVGAEIDLHSDFREEYDAAFFAPDFSPPHPSTSNQDEIRSRIHTFLTRHGIVPGRRLRIEERLVKPADALFVAGTLTENPGVPVRPLSSPGDSPDNDSPDNDSRSDLAPHEVSIPLPAPEIIRLSSGAVPTATREMSQQAKIAAALNRAGAANGGVMSAAAIPNHNLAVEENEPAVPVFAHDLGHDFGHNEESPCETRSKQARSNNAGPIEDQPVRSDYNLAPPVVLMKGANHPRFVISFRNHKERAGALAWKSAVMVWGGAAITLFALYLLWAQMAPQ